MVKQLAPVMIQGRFVTKLMTMRATVTSPVPGPTDDWGRPGPPTQGPPREIPCFVQQDAEREAISERVFAVVGDMRLICPEDSEISERDTVLTIKDLRGKTVLWDGPFDVEAVMPRPPGSFKAVMLRRAA